MNSQEKINYLLITIDSCRWDSFQNANTSNLNSLCDFKNAFTQGTFTYASHMAMYKGIFPSIRENINYYNRFSKPIFRINNRDSNVSSFINFPRGTKTIIDGFNDLDYFTIGIAAMQWFKDDDLTKPFFEFHFTGINASKQIDIFLNKISTNIKPFFGLINMGETHDPYEFGGDIECSNKSRARARSFRKDGFDKTEWEKQSNACSFLDKKIGELISELKQLERRTLCIICGDHGECFGEDNCFGHGFYHPNVMSVPLGIFGVNMDFP